MCVGMSERERRSEGGRKGGENGMEGRKVGRREGGDFYYSLSLTCFSILFNVRVITRAAELGLHSIIDQGQSRRNERTVANPDYGLRQTSTNEHKSMCVCVYCTMYKCSI